MMGVVGCNKSVETHQEIKTAEETVDNKVQQTESQKDNEEKASQEVEQEKPKEIELTQEEKQAIAMDQLIDSMTIEEKVGQLFMIAYRGEGVTALQDTMVQDLQDYGLGGIILFGENIQSPDQTKDFIADLQANSKCPLFIGVDEEGGRVSRITNNPAMGYEPIESMLSIGNKDSVEEAQQLGFTLGKTLKELGFNLDFAPIADIYTNPENTVIGDRAFGKDAERVKSIVPTVVREMQKQGVSATVKHFPGHGDTFKDSHDGQVKVQHDLQRLREVEFLPFEAAINVGVDMVMVGHILTPQVTTDNLPASLSKEMVTDLLRAELNYSGVVITDALEMGAIANEYTSTEACILAIEAGVDILLMPQEWKEAYTGVLDAIQEGRLDEDMINQAVRRILKVKVKRGIMTLES